MADIVTTIISSMNLEQDLCAQFYGTYFKPVTIIHICTVNETRYTSQTRTLCTLHRLLQAVTEKLKSDPAYVL